MKVAHNFFLVLTILLAGCTSGTPVSETLMPPPTQPLFTPTPTATLRTIVTRTPTPIQIPEGAGPVETPVEVEFHTHLEELTEGDYLVVQTLGDEQEQPNVERFRYLSLDGETTGLLFTLYGESSRKYIQSGQNWILDLSGEEGNDGFLFIDFAAQNVAQYNKGCGGYESFSGSVGAYFAFTCSSGGQIWHVVSETNWRSTSYSFESTQGFNYLRWITSDLAVIENSDNNENYVLSHPPLVFCTLRMPEGAAHCYEDMPYWWGNPESEVSPDGKTVVVDYRDPDSQKHFWGLIAMDCLEYPDQEKCVPEVIRGIEDVISYSDPRIDWTSDGLNLIFVDIEGIGGSKTTIWKYNLEQKQVTLLTTYGSNDTWTGPWTSDGEYFILVDEQNPTDKLVWLVSSVTGEMHRIAGGLPGNNLCCRSYSCTMKK